ncbi:unnamed protein product [Symbiodinium sp. CCMP2592]|nr:unnamed protein product [Symbiodinium sp. CCMP2592]
MSPELLSLLQQAFRSPRRTASPSTHIMAEAAPPTGMGNRQLPEWIQEWGSAWDFLGLAPGSAMSEVLRADKRTAIRLHPDKSPPDEVEMATVRMQALGNASSTQAYGRWGTPFYDTSSEEFSSAGPDTVLPSVWAPPVLGRCLVHEMRLGEAAPALNADLANTKGHPRQQKGSSKGPYGDHRPGTLLEAKGLLVMENLRADLRPVDVGEQEKLLQGMNLVPHQRALRPEPTHGHGLRRHRLLRPRARVALVRMQHIFFLEEIAAYGTAADAPPKEKIPTKAPPPSTFNNTMRWICGGCGEPNGLHRRGLHIGSALTVKKKHGELINNGPTPDDLLVHPRASTAPVVLNRRDTVDGGPGPRGSQWESLRKSRDGEPQAPPPPAAAATPQPPPPMPMPEPKSVYFAKKGLGKGKGMGAPPEGPLPHTPATPKSYAPGDFANVGAPPPTSGGLAPKKARGPTEESRPMAIVAPNGEALWFTVRDLDETTPRLVLPWTIFQHVVMCRRTLCGLQSWSRVGVIFIRRVAQDILHWACRMQMANSGNPCFMDLQEAHPEPQGDLPPLSPATGDHRPLFTFQDFLRNPSLGQHYRSNEGPPRPGRTALPCIYAAPIRQLPLAESYAEADRAQNVMGRWAMQILGDEPAVPPDEGAPPADEGKAKGGSAPSSTSIGKGMGNTFKRATHWSLVLQKEECVVSDEEEEEDDVALHEEELEEVARLERECAELEQRMRGLNAGQQRALLENLANSSSAVMGGLLADTIRRTAQLRGQKGKGGSSNVKVRASNETARNDPKYMEDLDAGVSIAVAFQRHRSRLRAVQHQVAQGSVALQPRSTPLQTVRALPPMMSLGRSHRLYLLNRLERLERQGVTWTQDEVGNCYTMEQFLDYLEARVNADAERAEPTTASKSAGAPPPSGVPPPSPYIEHLDGDLLCTIGYNRGEAAGDTAPAGNDLPADDSARRSAVDGFHL